MVSRKSTAAVLHDQIVRTTANPQRAREPCLYRRELHRQRLLLGDANRKLLASLTAATTQNFATGFGLHTLAKAVGSFPTDSTGLISPLHKILLDLGAKWVREIALGVSAVNDRLVADRDAPFVATLS